MTMRDLAGVSDTALTDAWQWSGHAGGQLQKRDALYLSLQDEQSAVAQARRPATEAEQILVLADQALGELQGLLAQLSDGVLDIPPAGGERTLRDILAHVLLMERRYAQQTSYALRRSEAEPVYRALHVELGASERGGGIDEWTVRLAAARKETYAACSALDAACTGAGSIVHLAAIPSVPRSSTVTPAMSTPPSVPPATPSHSREPAQELTELEPNIDFVHFYVPDWRAINAASSQRCTAKVCLN